MERHAHAEWKNPTHRWDAFAFRVRQFLSGLSPQHRAEIDRRIRFYSLP